MDWGRSAKHGSFSLRNCLVRAGEETTMAGTCPSIRCMIGPCCLERSRKERKGREPNWWRLPMRGSFFGPGGRFWACLGPVNILSRRRRMKGARREIVVARLK
ncbi:fumarate reductase subunit D [Striga asiatica]|uniref:Fumarate reductase subunit D n=1 Tax=Striga asiatica TaxID=4170 RepID=A0A5A7PU91_STRAF|nr:fumarate reductase subunit D [Striga asiatica]